MDSITYIKTLKCSCRFCIHSVDNSQQENIGEMQVDDLKGKSLAELGTHSSRARGLYSGQTRLRALGRLKTGQIANLTADKARCFLNYSSDTGILVWIRSSGKAKVGMQAGTRHVQGYIQIRVAGRSYLAHRLAWLLHTGEWPLMDIDHINGCKTDNRIVNLRLTTKQANMENFVRARKDSTSGLLGTSPSKGRWQSKIQTKGRTIYLGTFDTAQEAHFAYLDAKRVLHKGGTL